MSLVLNILWIVFGGGLVIFLQYAGAGIALCLSVVGIPWGIQSFKLALLALMPFGSEVTEPTETGQGGVGLVLNVIWLVIGGIWIFLSHVIFAVLCAITIIGIPFAVQHVKLAKLAFTPFGRDIREIQA